MEKQKDRRPLIIAEMSGNHNKSLERALAIVKAAAKAGVSAVKIQTFTPEAMTLDLKRGEFFIKEPKNPWKGQSLFRLYQEAYTPWEWHRPIFALCKKLGILGFSTPFDEKAVDFLEKLNVPMYKISSFEIIDIPLIRKVAATGKPIIMSVGMATVKEVQEALQAARSAGAKDITLLKCTSSYPATPLGSNLLTIPDMKKRFKCRVGLSDHSMGIGVALASIALGGTVIEKHFTLSRQDKGVDSEFSMEPDEMKQLVDEAKVVWQAIGKVVYGPVKEESISYKYRRSLYVIKDMKRGEILTPENFKSIRPGYGLSPKHYEKFIGRMVRKDVIKGTPISWDLIK